MNDQALAPFHQFLGKLETAILNPVITLLGLIAFVLFIWGVVEFIGGAANEEARQKGQRHIVWGIVGLVIMFAARAIIAIAAHTFGLSVPSV